MLTVDDRIHFDMVELQALRNEINTRVTIQNACILTASYLLFGSCVAMFAWPERALLAATGLAAAIGVCALVWCHNGIRQCQIKNYLLLLADRHSIDGGWENWLPGDRMPGLLGNRWFVSTKGAMVGSQGFGILIALYVGGSHALVPLGASLAIMAGTSVLLLTNPKESLRSGGASNHKSHDTI
jgi:hypothetical protein